MCTPVNFQFFIKEQLCDFVHLLFDQCVVDNEQLYYKLYGYLFYTVCVSIEWCCIRILRDPIAS